MSVVDVYYSLFFFKQKAAYEVRISDCSSDVCSSDLAAATDAGMDRAILAPRRELQARGPAHLHTLRHLVLGGLVGAERQQKRGQGGVGDAGGGVLPGDRTSLVEGKRVSVRLGAGGCRLIKKKKNIKYTQHKHN